MPVYGRVEAFEGKGSDWPLYLEQLEEFFTANGITDAGQQKSIFLASCGTSTYSLLRNLVAPERPRDGSFSRLTDLLTDHFTPASNEIVERCKFFSRSRLEGESVATFMAELRKLSEHCRFENVLDDMLRDRLVCGINKVSIQERLFAEPKLNLKKAMEIALTMEAAARDVTDLRHYQSATGRSENEFSPDVKNVNVLAKSENKWATSYEKVKGEYRNSKIKCYRCGGEHYARECNHSSSKCHKCGKMGHLARVCRSGASFSTVVNEESKQRRIKGTNLVEVDAEEDVYVLNNLANDLNSPILITVGFHNKTLQMELDCGAAISVIGKKQFDELWAGDSTLPLQATQVKLKSYCGNVTKACGQVSAVAEYGNKKAKLTLCVVPGERPMLLGRNWIRSLQIVPELFELHELKVVSLQSVLKKYEEVFTKEFGSMKGVLASIVVPEGVQPKFFKCRPVPFALKHKIEQEIDRLVAEQVLIPVKYARWATPIVPIVKDDGTIRIAGDFKTTVNPVSRLEQYPVPRIEELFAKLSGGKKFTKLDLRDAYLQMMLDEASRELVTINTTKGLFQYTRLPFGISSAPAIFLRAMDGLLANIKMLAIFFDDFVVTGRDDQEHLRNLEEVLGRLQEAGLKLKKEKCVFMQDEIEYLGYKLDAEGLHPTHEKIEAVHKAVAPTCVRELQAYLGLLNYYRRFLPGVAKILAPLHRLLQKEVKWQWEEEEMVAFKMSKDLLISDALLVYFDPSKPIIVSCDASPVGIGGVLSHRFEDGSERPVGYISRSLSKAEKNYSQLDKEALALTYAVTKFHQYVYGFKFELQTDHEPLLGLFQAGKAVPIQSSPRVVRWALKLATYEYSLVYKPGKKNGNADALSRLPLPVCPEMINRPAEVFMLEKEYPHLLSEKSIAKWTNRDKILAEVRRLLWAGDKLPENNSDFRPFANRQVELSIQGSCVLWGARVLIPVRLQESVLSLLHEGHPGISRMKSIARSHVWWPKLDMDIEQLVKLCVTCQANHRGVPHVPLHSWPFPSKPWSRLHIDHAGPFQEKIFFIVVDAYSKWVEVHKVASTAACSTIACLRNIFAAQGIPDLIVSDNGTAFDNVDFKTFLKSNGIDYLPVPPYHPSSNGAAERVVQTVKTKLKKCTGGDWSTKLARFLLHYRTQQHETTGVSPAELLNNRKLKTLLSCIHPELDKNVRQRQLQSKLRYDSRVQGRQFQIGEEVFARNFRAGPRWVPGIIEDTSGPVTFAVRVQAGVWHRHADHLRSRVNGAEIGTEGFLDSQRPCMPNTAEINEGELPRNLNQERPDLEIGADEEVSLTGGELVRREPPEAIEIPNKLRRSCRVSRPPDKLNL